MNKEQFIKYFKKQLYCPICSTKLDFKYDSRIDYISGRCIAIKYYDSYHTYDYHSASDKFGFQVNVALIKDHYHIMCKFDCVSDSYDIKVFTKEEKDKENSSYWNNGKRYVAVPCITKTIYEPREYYGFLSKIFKKLKVFE